MKRLLLATRNAHKKKELAQLLVDTRLSILTLDDIESVPEIEEDGKTFEENAVKKACETARWTGKVCLADDSGLEVDFLEGRPGVFSARFAGERATDAANNRKLLQLLENVADDQRTARFVCVIAICDPHQQVDVVRGECEGSITSWPAGNGGFGYDPLFVPRGRQKTLAELSELEKNRISHRGRALAQAVPLLKRRFMLDE